MVIHDIFKREDDVKWGGGMVYMRADGEDIAPRRDVGWSM
jgi:hypothetical protein